MTKLYTIRSNSIRAARAQLGKDAQQGIDFVISGSAGAYTFAVVEKPKPTEKPNRTSRACPKTRRGSKIGNLLERARAPEGITTAQIHDLTGWTKIGSFFGAVKRSGLTLHSCREVKDARKDTRWFAVDAALGLHAYVAGPEGWAWFGAYEDEEAVEAAVLREAPKGTKVTISRGKHGELHIRAVEK